MLCHKCYNGYYHCYPWVACSSCRDPQPSLDLPEDVIKQLNTEWKVNHEVCFIAKCVREEESPNKVDDYIASWHNSTSKFDLPTFLGMNIYEYEKFLNSPDEGIKQAIDRRKRIANFSK